MISVWIPEPTALSFSAVGFCVLVSRMLAAIILFSLLLIAAIFDLRTREIPDWISIAVIVAAFSLIALKQSPITWSAAAIGFVLGLLLSAPLFYLGGIGGGDVKLIAAMGAMLGPLGLLNVLFWIAIAGGILALIAKCRGKTDFAYVPAFVVGYGLSLFSS